MRLVSQLVQIGAQEKHSEKTAQQGYGATASIFGASSPRHVGALWPEPLFERHVRNRRQTLRDVVQIKVMRLPISLDHAKAARVNLESQGPGHRRRRRKHNPKEKISMFPQQFHAVAGVIAEILAPVEPAPSSRLLSIRCWYSLRPR